MFTYKGYTGQVEVDVEAGILFGEVLEIYDVVTFQGKTVEEARQEFQNSVDDYLEFCAKLGRQPDKPFSGRLPYRTNSDTHRKIFIAAKKAGKSINAWMDEVLREAADKSINTKRKPDSAEEKPTADSTEEKPNADSTEEKPIAEETKVLVEASKG
ncbi:type II toxin-antitoxin system HicB family antitoxin [[Phormidium] sp. ETS-05]|uniref:type II toxin-antitoxin system HicB family antitoxin n=1 Tax=[Phormidium] sp. ETS-05 TaxID=222819 RepID=UPI0018EF3107|nr:type II toxin-antitoxin system HicB family antitoxin [[Phormidium] sp. ETS-05]